jgi:hypothetical protein
MPLTSELPGRAPHPHGRGPTVTGRPVAAIPTAAAPETDDTFVAEGDH